MFVPLFLVAAVMAAGRPALGVTVDDCPAFLNRDSQQLRAFGSSCYLFFLDHSREFDTAERECEAKHGHLVIIRDLETQNFLYNTLHNEFHYSNDVVWIGLSDAESEGHYVWVDGTPAKFTYWAPGQPGFWGHLVEDCVAMDVEEGGKWQDFHCADVLFVHNRHSFICEYPVVATTPPPTTTPTATTTREATTTSAIPATTTPPPPTTAQPPPTSSTTEARTTTTPQPTTPQPTTPQPTMPKTTTPQPTTPQPTTPQPTTTPSDSETTTGRPTLGVTIDDCPAFLPRDSQLRAFGSSCYVFFLDHARAFDTAKRECEAKHGHLVIIRDLDTQNFLYNTLHNEFHYSNDVVWIGLSDAESEGHYVWVDGTPAKFTYWAPDQPGLSSEFEDCVVMDLTVTGKWQGYHCEDGLFNRHSFICEYAVVTNHQPQPAPSTAEARTTPAQSATTPQPTTAQPTTAQPTTAQPTTAQPTTAQPTTAQPTMP